MSDRPKSHTPVSADSVYGIEVLIRPIEGLMQHKVSGAVLLMLATAAAMAWANSPWAHEYEHLIHLPVSVGIGAFSLEKTLLHWINDGVMGFFFFTVGLEIKRELLVGDLSTPRKALLPVAAALGGMIVPALLYAVVNAGGAGAHGWGIPMATDIAFALGVLALLGHRAPPGLTVFLTALAIADDVGGILVIAVFYTEKISLLSLAVGGGLFAVSIVANKVGVRSAVFYFIVGAIVWLAFLKSGVHATLAAVLMALTIPARTRIDRERFVTRMTLLLDSFRQGGVTKDKTLLSHDQESVLEEMAKTIDKASAPVQRVEHAHAGVVTFLVLPLFALGNAGVALGDGLLEKATDPVSLGILVGLFLGKPIGIFSFTFLAVKLGLGDLPPGVTWRMIHGAATLGGIGFTMALFIGGLAFRDPALVEIAKVGIFGASVLSGVLGFLLLRYAPPPEEAEPAPAP